MWILPLYLHVNKKSDDDDDDDIGGCIAGINLYGVISFSSAL